MSDTSLKSDPESGPWFSVLDDITGELVTEVQCSGKDARIVVDGIAAKRLIINGQVVYSIKHSKLCKDGQCEYCHGDMA